MRGKPLFWFLASLTVAILLVYYQTFTTLNKPENFRDSSADRNNPALNEAGNGLIAGITYRVNASSPEKWVYFDFSEGSTVDISDRSSFNWDLGFKRSLIISNGGETNPKRMGGIIELNHVQFESVTEAPETGYTVDMRTSPEETENPAVKKWYDYSYWSHSLTPKNNIYVIRTADGRYAKMQILKYYCGRVSGCYTIKYVYQGNGSRKFTNE